jgi:hypothetical protein
LLMIPQSNNVLNAASAIVMCKIKLFAWPKTHHMEKRDKIDR